jgi:hypothetical protein
VPVRSLRGRLDRLEAAALPAPRPWDAAAPELRDPLAFAHLLWPGVTFYHKQVEVVRSVEANDETFVVAGHQLGKDFVAGFITLWYFLAHQPVRVVTTSVKDDHLRVLWGEIGRFIDTAREDTPLGPLSARKGGPLVVHRRELRKVVGGRTCAISYCRGMVSQKGEGLAGHHAEHTLLVVDEASGVDDVVYERGDTWAKKKLIVGNPYPCNNFFFKAVKAGDVLAGS